MILDKAVRCGCICLFLATLLFTSAEAKSESADAETSGAVKVIDVVADCYVADFGQTVRSFDITVDNADAVKGLTREDFTIRNAAVTFEYGLLEEDSITDVAVNGNRIRLKVVEFLLFKSNGEGPLEGKPLTVSCDAQSVYFSFSYSDITAKTDIIDDFRFDVFKGMEYYLYTPDDTAKPQPLMVYLHGNTMAGIQLRFCRAASHFASPEIQAKQQTYVFAPTSMKNKTGEWGWNPDEIDRVVQFIGRLIDDGKVDKKRIYIQGNSMGGMGTLRAILAHPDFFAAAMPMCGAIDYKNDNRRIFESKAEKIIQMPIWLLHARNDTIVNFEDTEYVYNHLRNIGAKRLKATWVDDDMLERYGIHFAHAADIVTIYMPEVANWFFEQRLR